MASIGARRGGVCNSGVSGRRTSMPRHARRATAPPISGNSSSVQSSWVRRSIPFTASCDEFLLAARVLIRQVYSPGMGWRGRRTAQLRELAARAGHHETHIGAIARSRVLPLAIGAASLVYWPRAPYPERCSAPRAASAARSEDLRLRHSRTVLEEIKIATLRRLRDMLAVEARVAARRELGRAPRCAPRGKFAVRYVQVQAPR